MDSDIVSFLSDGMGLVTIDLNDINLDDNIFDEDCPANIFLLDLLLGAIDLINMNHVKKD